MLTKLTVRNFKRFEEVEIELGDAVVFIGPNNSGKSSALQALALWEIGLRRWSEKRMGRSPAPRRPGVSINRRDLGPIPVPDANLLWRDLHVRDVTRGEGGKTRKTENVRVDVVVEGVTGAKEWQCGLEFDYANEESLYCRPLRRTGHGSGQRMAVPEEAIRVHVAFLPPMAGLAAQEARLDLGAVNVRLGEGRTAEVLRNLCYRIVTAEEGGDARWRSLCQRIQSLFGVELEPPEYISERGEIAMAYREPPGEHGVRLDLSSAGRGLHQTLLLLAHLAANPGSVLLLDEPDAHLEILRQRQIYQIVTEWAREQGSQIIAASHSEVVLNEAAGRDIVVAFLGRPHRIDDRGSQLLKALREIGFDQYYQADQKGWVLYLEGSTDLAVLQELARKLDHPAQAALERPFVKYVENQPGKARDHFFGLREARPDLLGFALYDNLSQGLHESPPLQQVMWTRREMENYLCTREVLLTWADAEGQEQEGGPLFGHSWRATMERCIGEIEAAFRTLGRSPWAAETKVSDEFLDPLFRNFFQALKLPDLMRKTDYHVLARHLESEDVDPEVVSVLDHIAAVARQARPAEGK